MSNPLFNGNLTHKLYEYWRKLWLDPEQGNLDADEYAEYQVLAEALLWRHLTIPELQRYYNLNFKRKGHGHRNG